jgi:hypothetical protein
MELERLGIAQERGNGHRPGAGFKSMDDARAELVALARESVDREPLLNTKPLAMLPQGQEKWRVLEMLSWLSLFQHIENNSFFYFPSFLNKEQIVFSLKNEMQTFNPLGFFTDANRRRGGKMMEVPQSNREFLRQLGNLEAAVQLVTDLLAETSEGSPEHVELLDKLHVFQAKLDAFLTAAQKSDRCARLG